MMRNDEFGKMIKPELEWLVNEYMTKAKQLDKILGALTKDYCANECNALPTGCCFTDFYNHGIDPCLAKILWAIHKEGSKANAQPRQKLQSTCDYHTREGCALETKSPVCIGFMCKELADHMLLRCRLDREAEPKAQEFVHAMNHICSASLSETDSPKLFYYMEKAIGAGNEVIMLREENLPKDYPCKKV
jgi:hypothetical protein